MKMFFHHVDDEIGVAGPVDRHHAVVDGPRPGPEGIEDLAQLFPPLPPVKEVFLLVHPTTAAHPLVVEGEVQGVVGRIQAAGAIPHITSSGRYSKRSFSRMASFSLAARPSSSKPKPS